MGPARSGTSWLQTILAEHPEIASPPETELFSAYIVPMARSWERHRALVEASLRDGDQQMAYGLAAVLNDDEFVGLMRSFYETVRDTVLAAKPGASHFLEKTPDHSLFLDAITQVVPDARVIFLVRDPRDTVRSLLEASREPWGHWAPRSVVEATDLWLRNVRAVLPWRTDPRVMTVRYEDLAAGPDELERVAKFLGLERPSEWLTTPLEVAPGQRSSMVTRGAMAERDVKPYDAAAFSYHDRDQRRQLTARERGYVVAQCQAEMRTLGYATESDAIPAAVRAELVARKLWVKAKSIPHRVARRVASRRSN